MDVNYFVKIQDAYGVKSRREKELIKINRQMSRHFEDTFDTENVTINGRATQLMIIKDTDGNTFKKKIKSKHGNRFNLGDYVEWNGQTWLVTLIDADEKTWNRGYMYLCTFPLRWQNAEGKIIERCAYIEDFTKSYNNAQGIETLIHDNASLAKDSAALAAKVQNYLAKGTKQQNRGVKRQPLAMCSCPAMGTNASILIEVGFMTNEYEARLIRTDAFCLECAEEAAQGVCEYLGVPYVKGGKPAGSAAAAISVPNIPKAPAAASNAYSKAQFIKEVQIATGAKPDGIAGNETLSKTVTVSKAKNNRHAVVRPVQKYLNSTGYNCGAADGIFGAATDAAVRAFQMANGCTADGELTQRGKSWKKLLGIT